MHIRSGQSGDNGVMYSDGIHTVSCRKIEDSISYLVTENERLHPLLYRIPIIRVMEKLRVMFKNTHQHSHFLKGTDNVPRLMSFYLRFVLFMIVVAPVYLFLMWIVWEVTRPFPFYWLELLVEAVLMYGLFMLIASSSMSAQSKRYHSAEHQAINAFRTSSEKPSVDESLVASRFHANCGTGAAFSVAVGVFLTLILFYSFVPVPGFFVYCLLNFLLFPLGVSIGLELFSLIPNLYRMTGFTFLVYPSFLLQRFTTKKATSDEVEIAVLAIERLLMTEKESQK
jgi:uncharacterized protein YqhQ